MGRPIKKKWFTARDVAGWTGDLTVTTTVGAEAIIKQVGTGVYEVASGRVKLIDGVPAVAAAPGVVGDAQLAFAPTAGGGGNVSKVNQYRMYFFDPAEGSAQWRDKADPAVIQGVLTPALTPEGGVTPVTATGTAVMVNLGVDDNEVDSVTITDGGAGYTVAPAVTFSAGDGAAPVTATGTAVLTGDAVSSVTMTEKGSYADLTTATVTFAAP